MNYGCVDRILTTNFDPLIARACALFNQFPAVYDLTMSRLERMEDLAEVSAFHLHGQRHGFNLLNREDELKEHCERVAPLFQHAAQNRVWIVCGYSGENDPLLNLVKRHERYEYGLYWLGRDPEPPAHLADLFSGNNHKQCHYIQIDGADEFFIRLAGSLDSFPPKFMDKPLDHALDSLNQLAAYPTGKSGLPTDLLAEARKSIEDSIKVLTESEEMPERKQEKREQAVRELLVSKGLEHALAEAGDVSTLSDELRGELAFQGGLIAYNQAGSVQGDERTVLYRVAAEQFQRATSLRPNESVAPYNLGVVISRLARETANEEAKGLWMLASESYERAVQLQPDMCEALNGWSVALIHLSYLLTDSKRQVCRELALEKANRAEELNAGSGSYNMACVLTLLGQKDEALDALKRCHEYDKIPKHLDEDKDLESLRGWPPYEEWRTTLAK